ncbi:nucleotidyltransferase family protein [Kovacikia minuta CCNUW1]|uniref:nucleotidyltransferase family protein n=1 Tax=Kovacikia minuta TaxID=2931930 RepID=UPI001CCD31A7|nr:nucleotidyltransferase family protein [Kovacikia minuta]UBF29286.1 nucleotidyltransferase family protein [Kovacikia minuta CCNUW1]
MSGVGLVILAAGASSRLGTPKQLLSYQGQSLIQHVVEKAIASICDPVMVVLGAHAARIRPELAAFDVQVIENLQWSEGISTAVRSGVTTLQMEYPGVEAVVLWVCDQPFVSTQRINQLVATYQRSQPLIVASEYAGVAGVPALFHHTLFPELLALNGDMGARKIIQRHPQNTLRISCPEGAIDIDTPAEYERLMNCE